MASRSEASTALPEPSKGLSGIVAADTTLSFIDGEKGILKYCGYGIDDLAANVFKLSDVHQVGVRLQLTEA